MTYIRWQDELSDYLVSLPKSERDKIFSYFSEMYADKRDAGFSEEEIVEEFGAPYDVAKRILSDNPARENADPEKESASHSYGYASERTTDANDGRHQAVGTVKVKKRRLGLKIFGLIAGLIIAALLIIFFVALGKSTRIEIIEKTYTSPYAVTKIDVTAVAGRAECRYYDGDRVTIDYYEEAHFGFTVSQLTDTLTFTPDENKRLNFIDSLAFSLYGWDKIPKIVIKIPASQKVDLKIEVNAGSFLLGEGMYGDVELTVKAGQLTTGNLECDKLGINLSAGEIISSAVCNEMTVRVSAGSASLGECRSSSLKAQVSAGSASFAELDCPVIDVDVSAGSFDIKLLIGELEDYSAKCDVSAGSCSLIGAGQTISGTTDKTGNEPDKRITAKVSAGNVSIRFVN